MAIPPKKKLAVIDHSFHKMTRSTEFFWEILRREYEVTVFYDESSQGGAEFDIALLNRGKFDVVLFLQVLPRVWNFLRLACENVVWVPMYDSEKVRSDRGWQALCGLDLKVLCFSGALYESAQRAGIDSFRVQYFPEPAEQAVAYGNPRVFLWQRINEINWPLVKRILAGNPIEKVVLKDDPDPGFAFDEPSSDDIEKFNIEIVRKLNVGSGASHHDYLALLSNCNVFIAPRLSEGIGRSFLEAMALGMCVVAADEPTMNEYIASEDNGFLFDPEDTKAIDIAGFAECGRRAKEAMARGRQHWQASLPDLLHFIAKPARRNRSAWRMFSVLLWDAARRWKYRVATLRAQKGD